MRADVGGHGTLICFRPVFQVVILSSLRLHAYAGNFGNVTRSRKSTVEFGMGPVIAYVVSGTAAAGAITPVDTRTHAAGAPIVIGGGAQSITVTPNGKTVYVPNGVLNAVTALHTATNTLLPPIPVGGEPFAIVATPDGKTVYVGNTTSASVTPIRVSTNSPLPDIQVGNGPFRVVITPNGRTLYTVNANDNTVTPIRVSTNTAEAAISVGGVPQLRRHHPRRQDALRRQS
jgi:YVTN family beta-propeller protein